jgi:sugar/nucleoside kinase (ribokinase family)
VSAAGRRVVVIGDVMTDIVVLTEGGLVRGSDRRARISSGAGGSGANQAVWLAAMGVAVTMIGRAGVEDAEAWRRHFSARGVEPVLAEDDERPTGTLIAIVDPDGERSFLTDRGANLGLVPADIPPEVVEAAAMLVVSGYALFAPGPRQAVRAAMARARGHGVAVAVDAASTGFLDEVGPASFLEWTAGADLVFANEEEAGLLTGKSEAAEQVSALGRHFGQVVIKRGAQGAVAGTRAGLLCSAASPDVMVVDSTGAGDAFAAGFIAELLAGGGTEAALRSGVAAGSEAVGRVGAQPPMKGVRPWMSSPGS